MTRKLGPSRSADMVDEVVAAFGRERPDIDPVLLELVSRLIVAGRLSEADGVSALADLEGHYTDFDVLGMLRTTGHPFEMTPAQLMQRVMLTSGAMTACLRRMEGNGLIVRRTDDQDRRVKHVRLTDKGRSVADEALSRRYAHSAERLAVLSPEEQQTLLRLLRRLGEFESSRR